MAQYQFPGSMTNRQFNAAAKRADISPKWLTRARRVLVDGESAQDVAGTDEVDDSQVYEAIHKVCSSPRR